MSRPPLDRSKCASCRTEPVIGRYDLCTACNKRWRSSPQNARGERACASCGQVFCTRDICQTCYDAWRHATGAAPKKQDWDSTPAYTPGNAGGPSPFTPPSQPNPQFGGQSFGGGAAPPQFGGQSFGGGAGPQFGGQSFGGSAAPPQSGGSFGGGAGPQHGGSFGGGAPPQFGGQSFGGSAAPQSGGSFGGGAGPQHGGSFGGAAVPQSGGSFGGGAAPQSESVQSDFVSVEMMQKYCEMEKAFDEMRSDERGYIEKGIELISEGMKIKKCLPSGVGDYDSQGDEWERDRLRHQVKKITDYVNSVLSSIDVMSSGLNSPDPNIVSLIARKVKERFAFSKDVLEKLVATGFPVSEGVKGNIDYINNALAQLEQGFR